MFANTRLHDCDVTTSQHHIIAIHCNSFRTHCRPLKTGFVDHIAFLQTPIILIPDQIEEMVVKFTSTSTKVKHFCDYFVDKNNEVFSFSHLYDKLSAIPIIFLLLSN